MWHTMLGYGYGDGARGQVRLAQYSRTHMVNIAARATDGVKIPTRKQTR